MPDPAPNAEVLRSLGRLVRGLSILFWGLPTTLIVCIQTGRTEWLRTFGLFPPIVTTALLFYGLWQLENFQKHERPWRKTLDRAKILALIDVGLSPFVYWWSRVPSHWFFTVMLDLFAVSSLLFLCELNLVLQRLGAMLPDETLRHETRQFGSVNRYLLLAILILLGFHLLLTQTPGLPPQFGPPALMRVLARFGLAQVGGIAPFNFLSVWIEHGSIWVLILLLLLPLAMTMALIWKTKEVIFDSVFGLQR